MVLCGRPLTALDELVGDVCSDSIGENQGGPVRSPVDLPLQPYCFDILPAVRASAFYRWLSRVSRANICAKAPPASSLNMPAITLINHQGLKIVKGIQLQSPSPSIGLAYIGGYLRHKGLSYTGIDACGEALDQVYPYGNMNDIVVQGLTIPRSLSAFLRTQKSLALPVSFPIAGPW